MRTVPLVRWLVSLCVLLSLLGQPVAAFVSAGTKTDATCCCPSPDVCTCHDHDGRGSDETIKRCAGSEHQVLPAVATATIAAVVDATDIPRVECVIEHDRFQIPPRISSEPEQPPF